MIHLYAMLPAETVPQHTPVRSENCLRLAQEFQHLLIRRHGLRKVFVSIKGYYFQCEIDGVTISWMTPHKFPTQPNGREVDFRTLLTFLDFYETLLKFVNFKLYHESELAYPPRIDITRDAAGAHLASLVIESESARKEVEMRAKLAADDHIKSEKVEKEVGSGKKGSKKRKKPAVEADKASKKRQKLNKRDIPCRNFADTGKCEFGAKGECVFICGAPRTSAEDADEKPKDEKIPSLDDLVSSIDDDDADQDEEWQPSQTSSAAPDAADAAIAPPAQTTEEPKDEFAHLKTEEERAAEAAQSHAPDLFKGFKFLLMRESPQEQLEFVIRCFSGEVVRQTSLSSADDLSSETITHQIVDRPRVDTSIKSREYVQPQWVFDSINERCRLPVSPYAPGVSPPHHLSPFVNNDRVGYIPAAVEQRQRWTQGDVADPVAAQDEPEAVEEEESDEDENEEEGNDSSDDMEESDGESAPSDPSPQNSSKRLRQKQVKASDSDNESDNEDSDTEAAPKKKSKKNSRSTPVVKSVDQHSHRDLEKIMMPKKSKRLYEKMMHGHNRRSDFNEKLLAKRRKIEKKAAKK